MRGSTGSILGDLVAYTIVGAIIFAIGIIWQIITGGHGNDKK